MTNQSRDVTNFQTYPELELLLKMSQLESSLKFLDYMNNGHTVTGEPFPRNVTERSSVSTNLERIKECRVLLKGILNDRPSPVASQPDNQTLADQQFLHDS